MITCQRAAAQVDDVTKQLKTNNMKLKGIVTQVHEQAARMMTPLGSSPVH